MTKNKPSIILYDIETSPMKTATFSLYQDSIGHTNILQDWYIFCFAYKKLGESKVTSVSLTDFPKPFKADPTNDYHVVKALGDVLRSADMTIGHNHAQFDLKKANARLIFHKLAPVPKHPQLDTLKEFRKIAKFSSNRLDYLGQHLGYGGKTPTSQGLWLRALGGEAKAIDEMTRYCCGDVKLLEKIYNRILPHIQSHPHIGVMNGEDRYSCPNCGSKNLTNEKIRYSASGVKKQQVKCSDCFAYSTHPFK